MIIYECIQFLSMYVMQWEFRDYVLLCIYLISVLEEYNRPKSRSISLKSRNTSVKSVVGHSMDVYRAGTGKFFIPRRCY